VKLCSVIKWFLRGPVSCFYVEGNEIWDSLEGIGCLGRKQITVRFSEGLDFGCSAMDSVRTSPLFRRVRKIVKNRLLASSCPSVRPSARNNSAPTVRIFMKFYIYIFFLFFRKSVEKIQVSLKSNKIRVLYMNTFLIISLSFLLRMRGVLDKSCRENQNKHFVFSNFFSFFFSKIVPFMR
jgi:hypothetical protein